MTIRRPDTPGDPSPRPAAPRPADIPRPTSIPRPPWPRPAPTAAPLSPGPPTGSKSPAPWTAAPIFTAKPSAGVVEAPLTSATGTQAASRPAAPRREAATSPAGAASAAPAGMALARGPRLQLVTDDHAFAEAIARALPPMMGQVERVTVAGAGLYEPGHAPPVVVVDVRSGVDMHEVESLRRDHPLAQVLVVADERTPSTRAFGAGAMVALPPDVEAVVACFLSLVERHRALSSELAAASADRARLARIYRLAADLREEAGPARALARLLTRFEGVERVVLFVATGDHLAAVGAVGMGAGNAPLSELVRGLRLLRSAAGVFDAALGDGEPRIADFAGAKLPEPFASLVARPGVGRVVVLPVVEGKRPVGAAYMDGAIGERNADDLVSMQIVASLRVAAVESRLLHRQLAKAQEGKLEVTGSYLPRAGWNRAKAAELQEALAAVEQERAARAEAERAVAERELEASALRAELEAAKVEVARLVAGLRAAEEGARAAADQARTAQERIEAAEKRAQDAEERARSAEAGGAAAHKAKAAVLAPAPPARKGMWAAIGAAAGLAAGAALAVLFSGEEAAPAAAAVARVEAPRPAAPGRAAPSGEAAAPAPSAAAPFEFDGPGGASSPAAPAPAESNPAQPATTFAAVPPAAAPAVGGPPPATPSARAPLPAPAPRAEAPPPPPAFEKAAEAVVPPPTEKAASNPPAPAPKKAAAARPAKGKKGGAAALVKKGDNALREGEIEKALAAYKQALAEPDAPPAAHRGLAAVYVMLGREKEAAAEYRKYLDLAPNAPDADQIRGLLEFMR